MHTIKPTMLAGLPHRLAFAASATFMLPVAAFAAGSGIPWEEPLQQILDSVPGPVAKIVADIIIIITGLALASGETSCGFRNLFQIVFALSVAFAASSFFPSCSNAHQFGLPSLKRISYTVL